MQIDPDRVPSTMEEAVNVLVDSLNDADREYIKEKGTTGVHFGAGMAMRNAWSFWEPDSPIKQDCVKKYRIAHADDMSGLLWAWVAAKVRCKKFDPVKYCERFHKHWAQYGTDSLAAGGWPPGSDGAR